MKLVLPDKNYVYRHPSQLPALFRNEDGAIDLASIMVGIIVIGIIGGIIAATIFAVIPWAQDAAAKHQLDSITQAENAYYGFTAGNLSNLPSGAKANSYSSSPMIAQSNFLEEAPNYCVVASADGKTYNSYSLSGTGKVWTTDNTNIPPTVYPGTMAQACPASYTNPNAPTGPVPAPTQNWPGQFIGTQSVGSGRMDGKTLSFSLPNTYSSYTVVWTDTLNNMNGGGTVVNTSTSTDSNGLSYWAYNINPLNSSGWTAGTATVTATITDNTTKQTGTKTWNIIIPSGAATSGDAMWNTTEAPNIQFVNFYTSAANPQNLYVTLGTDGKANQWEVGGSFGAWTKVTMYCKATDGSIVGPVVGTVVIDLSTQYGITNPGPNQGSTNVRGLNGGASCDKWQGAVPYSASAGVPDEYTWENFSVGSLYYEVGLLTPIANTTNFVAKP